MGDVAAKLAEDAGTAAYFEGTERVEADHERVAEKYFGVTDLPGVLGETKGFGEMGD